MTRHLPLRAAYELASWALSDFGEGGGIITVELYRKVRLACHEGMVPNGIPLSKIHYAVFDAHLIGIDADNQRHVSERLLAQNDGPSRLPQQNQHLRSIRDPPLRGSGFRFLIFSTVEFIRGIGTVSPIAALCSSAR